MSEQIPLIPSNAGWRNHKIKPKDEQLIELHPIKDRLVLYPYYAKQGIAYSSEKMYCREGVIKRLEVALYYLPSDMSLVVMDAWRSFNVQNELYQMWKSHFAGAYPELSPNELEEYTQKYVSLPSKNALSPAPHATGGSIDVVLMREGSFLPMGTDFDDMSHKAFTRYFEELNTNSNVLSTKPQQALENRRILFHAMTRAGFVGYAEEWWHFDYGNQWWGLQKDQPAIYDGIWYI